MVENLPTIAAEFRGVHGTLVPAVVKVAECVEAYTYYRDYGVKGSNEAIEVLDYLAGKLDEELSEARTRFPATSWWPQGYEWVELAKAII